MIHTMDNEAPAPRRDSWLALETGDGLSYRPDELRLSRRARSRADRHRSPYWILVEPEPPLSVFTLEAASHAPILPVFSSREEALCFVSESPVVTGALGVRESGGGELISLLSAPLRGVSRIALDPPAGYDPEVLELVCLGRRVFLDRLLGRGRPWLESSCSGTHSAGIAKIV